LLVSLYLLLPFIKIGGESAFRFDVPTLRLHFFGTVIWMQDFFVILLLAFFVLLLFFFLTLVFGRVWCGWACLQTVYCDLTGFMDHLAKKRLATKVASHIGMLGISIVLGFIAVCYFVSPYELLPKVLSLTLEPIPAGCGFALALISYLNFSFLRRTFCATICPYAIFQVMIVDAKSLIIKMDPEREEECIGCKLCVRGCPTGMDIRQGMRGNCIMCAECIDACNTAMTRKEKKRADCIQFRCCRQSFNQAVDAARSPGSWRGHRGPLCSADLPDRLPAPFWFFDPAASNGSAFHQNG
jgi:polyferredoxin